MRLLGARAVTLSILVFAAVSCRDASITSPISGTAAKSAASDGPPNAYACWLEDPRFRKYVAQDVASHIRGRVEDQSGNGLASMRVWVLVKDEAKRSMDHHGRLGAGVYELWTTTALDGTFDLPLINVQSSRVMVCAARTRDLQIQQREENVQVDCPDLVIRMAW